MVHRAESLGVQVRDMITPCHRQYTQQPCYLLCYTSILFLVRYHISYSSCSATKHASSQSRIHTGMPTSDLFANRNTNSLPSRNRQAGPPTLPAAIGNASEGKRNKKTYAVKNRRASVLARLVPCWSHQLTSHHWP